MLERPERGGGCLGSHTHGTCRATRFLAFLVVAILSVTGSLAQKTNVGYDKSVDFSRYKSYTLQAPETTGRPLLYMTVVSTISTEVESKGLASTETNGDLVLRASGSLDYGLNSDAGFTSDSCKNCKAPLVDPMEWTGKMAPPGSSGSPLPKGALELIFVDRASNKIIWAGTVVQKLDPGKKQKSLDLAHKAIKKLLMEFPPKP
jgi:hypothetical protein